MKKIFAVCIVATFLACISACGYSGNHVDGNNGDVDAMDYNGTNSNQSSHQHEERIHAGTPLYQNMEFFNVDELIAWIQTEDIENFQEGRYNNGISCYTGWPKSSRINQFYYLWNFSFWNQFFGFFFKKKFEIESQNSLLDD